MSTMAVTSGAPDHSRWLLAGCIAVSAAMSTTVVLTAWATETRLGAPVAWPWVLTGLQVLALSGAGRRLWWGWPLGAAVQPAWIAYAVLTGQFGFIPGCLVSAVVQGSNVLRAGAGEPPTDSGYGPRISPTEAYRSSSSSTVALRGSIRRRPDTAS